MFTRESSFLQRHVYLPSFYEEPKSQARAALEFWVEWHTFLRRLRLPTYQIEAVGAESIFRMAGLDGSFRPSASSYQVPPSTNARPHRPPFSWRELYTLDPRMAARAWRLAAEFGYAYPDVAFDELTCLPVVPSCNATTADSSSKVQRKCQAGTHPFPRERIRSKESSINEEGWVDGGCIEHRLGNGTYVGVPGTLR